LTPARTWGIVGGVLSLVVTILTLPAMLRWDESE
jgi:hypothetical protein